jgi:archaellin
MEVLNSNAIKILSSINGITNSMIYRYPRTVFNSDVGDILVSVNTAELQEQEFAEFGINSIDELLSAVGLFGDDKKIDLENGVITISEGSSSVQYITSNISLLKMYDKDYSIIEKTAQANTVCTFNLGSELIKNLKNASSVFKSLEDVIFQSQDGDLNITLGSLEKYNTSSNTYKTSIASESTKEFKISLPVDNFKKLPEADYVVEVKFNESKNAYRMILSHIELDMKILLALNT